MTQSNWPWFIPRTDKKAVDIIGEALGVNRLTAETLYQRGLHTPQDALRFLACDLADLGDPFCMKGIKTAALRLAAAVADKERILICGDYDVDGITATALLVRALQELAANVEYYIPSRFTDGYGLQAECLTQFAYAGGDLVITVDCGINSFAEMELAAAQGLDLIITDHHTCFSGERNALAVINPRQDDCDYPERNLAGVGVAWTLVRALYVLLDMPQDKAYRYLDLVALGTIADVVPMLGENRVLVKHGLLQLQRDPLPGLAALIRISGVDPGNLQAKQIAYTLAPRINAAGRLGDPDPAVRLLLAEDEQTACLYAQELDSLNRQRQEIEKEILATAQLLAAEHTDDAALVLWHADWNPGVIGIVAGRLATEYKRPVALIAVDDSEGRGSIRAIAGYDVVAALQACSEHLLRFGGHPEAAGFSVAGDQLDNFRMSFCQAVSKQEIKESLQPVTAAANLHELDLELARELENLAPFGQGHPEPLFLLQQLEVVSTRRVGNRGDHLRMNLRQNKLQVTAIRFGGGREDLASGSLVDAVVTAGINEWQGRQSLSLQIKDYMHALPALLPIVTDRRGSGQREQYISHLAKQKKLLVWVNTKASKDGLADFLVNRAHITQLGRETDLQQQFDALVLYHLPYDRHAFENLLGSVCFTGLPHVILCFGSEDAALNERIFSATFPADDVLLQIPVYVEQPDSPEKTLHAIRHRLQLQATNYFVLQIHAVYAELAAGSALHAPLTDRQLQLSPTYRHIKETLARFRAYQNFWQQACPEDLSAYLISPSCISLGEEGRCPYDSASTEAAN